MQRALQSRRLVAGARSRAHVREVRAGDERPADGGRRAAAQPPRALPVPQVHCARLRAARPAGRLAGRLAQVVRCARSRLAERAEPDAADLQLRAPQLAPRRAEARAVPVAAAVRDAAGGDSLRAGQRAPVQRTGGLHAPRVLSAPTRLLRAHRPVSEPYANTF